MGRWEKRTNKNRTCYPPPPPWFLHYSCLTMFHSDPRSVSCVTVIIASGMNAKVVWGHAVHCCDNWLCTHLTLSFTPSTGLPEAGQWWQVPTAWPVVSSHAEGPQISLVTQGMQTQCLFGFFFLRLGTLPGTFLKVQCLAPNFPVVQKTPQQCEMNIVTFLCMMRSVCIAGPALVPKTAGWIWPVFYCCFEFLSLSYIHMEPTFLVTSLMHLCPHRN